MRLKALAAAAVFLACTAGAGEVNAVYQGALEALFAEDGAPETIRVARSTLRVGELNPADQTRELLERCVSDLPEGLTLIEAYVAVNERQWRISELPAELSGAPFDPQFVEDESWGLKLSRPAFSKSGSLAMARVFLRGARGDTYLLERSGERWDVKRRCIGWVS